MKKTNLKFFYIVILILPWLTIPLLGRKAFKKYLPAAVFMSGFTKILDIFGKRNRWWRFYKGIPPFDSMNFFNFGPYLVTSLWILKMTYRSFPLYLISNLILHITFIFFGGVEYVKRFKIFSLRRLSKLQYFGIDIIRALLLYGFQYGYDQIRKYK